MAAGADENTTEHSGENLTTRMSLDETLRRMGVSLSDAAQTLNQRGKDIRMDFDTNGNVLCRICPR